MATEVTQCPTLAENEGRDQFRLRPHGEEKILVAPDARGFLCRALISSDSAPTILLLITCLHHSLPAKLLTTCVPEKRRA
jgi:hypothetical protein